MSEKQSGTDFPAALTGLVVGGCVIFAILFGIVYLLSEATLTTGQLIGGIAVAILVYSATMAWHIRNLMG